MANMKKVAIYSAAVGLVTPLVVKLLAMLPTVQVTLSAVEVNVRQNIPQLAGQGTVAGQYVLSLLGSPLADSPIIGYVYTIIGMTLLGLAGFWLAEQVGWAKDKMQRAIVPLALASVLMAIVVVPMMGGAAIGMGMLTVANMVLAINLAIGASVVTGINYLLGDPLDLVP